MRLFTRTRDLLFSISSQVRFDKNILSNPNNRSEPAFRFGDNACLRSAVKRIFSFQRSTRITPFNEASRRVTAQVCTTEMGLRALNRPKWLIFSENMTPNCCERETDWEPVHHFSRTTAGWVARSRGHHSAIETIFRLIRQSQPLSSSTIPPDSSPGQRERAEPEFERWSWRKAVAAYS